MKPIWSSLFCNSNHFDTKYDYFTFVFYENISFLLLLFLFFKRLIKVIICYKIVIFAPIFMKFSWFYSMANAADAYCENYVLIDVSLSFHNCIFSPTSVSWSLAFDRSCQSLPVKRSPSVG